jgi:DNA mismatch repair protein MutS2
LEIARICGVNEEILSKAKELVDSRESNVDALIEKIQTYREEIKEEREKVKNLTKEIADEKALLNSKQDELNRLISETKQAKGMEFIEELNSYREMLAKRITELQELNQRDAGKLNEEMMAIHKRVSSELSDEIAKKYSTLEEFDSEKASKGDRVFIVSIETEGIIEEIDLSDKSAVILLGGSIKSRFKFKDLLHVPHKEKGGSVRADARSAHTARITGISHSVLNTAFQTSYNTIDLRGKRVDEALTYMDASLDRMDRQGIKTVIIIHGHGTGAMKQAVRDNLKSNIYVSDFRPGDMGEGGDGVSVAVLRS